MFVSLANIALVMAVIHSAFSWSAIPSNTKYLRRNVIISRTARFKSAVYSSLQIPSSPSSSAEIDKPLSDEIDDDNLDRDSQEDISDRNIIMNVIIAVAEHYAHEKTMENLNPTILTDHAHILCRGRLYEDVIGDLINQATSPKIVTNLQIIDALMRGFVSSERKSRARLKVNYLLTAASANKFESAMDALSVSDELDDELLSFVRHKIKKEEESIGALDYELNDNNELVYDPSSVSSPSKDLSKSSQQSQALPVLRMVYKRIKAELLTSNNKHLKLLNRLVRCNPSDRIDLLEREIRQVDQLLSFMEYIRDAVDFVEENDGRGAQGSDRVQLAADTIEVIRDVLRDVEELHKQKFGHTQDVVFERTHDDSPPSPA